MTISKRIWLLLMVLCSLGVGAVVVRGQDSGGSTHEQILHALTALQRTVNTLQVSVSAVEGALNALQQDVNPLIAANQVNSRFTPVLTAPAYTNPTAGCSVVNVSSETRTIVVSLINTTSLQAELLGQETFTLQPGRSSGFGDKLNILQYAVFCSFTVIDGTRADIRASGSVRFPGDATRERVLAAE